MYSFKKAASCAYALTLVSEQDYEVRTNFDDDERAQAFRLRHLVFCKELRWVAKSSEGLEYDRHDEGAFFLGVFNNQNRLCAFIRIIPWNRPFMAEEDFSFSLDSEQRITKTPGIAETSRICVSPDARCRVLDVPGGRCGISMLLFKGVYTWCKQQRVSYLYTVVEMKMLRLLLLKGFPWRLLGDPVCMPDGTIAAAAKLDIRELEEALEMKNASLFKWFTQA
jgi:N-acyl-L-homoserine lactone synthetase